MEYYEIIRQYREDKDLTQESMAKMIGTNQKVYSRYERGENLLPITRLKEICRILNISADYVLGLPQLPYPKR